MDETAHPIESKLVPRKAAMNSGLITTTLMRCIAATPAGTDSSDNAFITKVEKAKNTPPTMPAPTEARSTSAKSIWECRSL
jgi:hypothetical protein